MLYYITKEHGGLSGIFNIKVVLLFYVQHIRTYNLPVTRHGI